MLRIDPARLDLVLNLSSELMVARARLVDQFRALQDRLGKGDWERTGATAADAGDLSARFQGAAAAMEGMEQTVRTVQRLASSVQSHAMRLRMAPVGPVFRRFERVVRDACRSTGHEARLVISGEGTELDKNLVDQLVDPLTHMIRNAVDHGIESPDERVRKSKRRRGTLCLQASHESGRFTIRVADDGRGIDPASLREAIARKGLLPEEQAQRLTDREAIAWIFESGFSTAAQVTDISGRGVGLDIVRSRIAALGGTIDVESQPGAGTAFSISLPLTLATVRALLVEAGGGRYALPLHAVREVVAVKADQVRQIAGSHQHIEVRRQLMPLVSLCPGTAMATAAKDGFWAVIARTRDAAVAITVDRVLREEELVVKPVPPQMRCAHGASGAAILGDGSIALFVDIDPLVARLDRQPVAEVAL